MSSEDFPTALLPIKTILNNCSSIFGIQQILIYLIYEIPIFRPQW